MWEFRWSSEPLISVSSSLLFCWPRRYILSPHAALAASQHTGKMAPICLPMNAFVRGEGLWALLFPPGQELRAGEEGTSVSFYCFYLSSSLRRFFFYLLNLKPNKKKVFSILLLIITSRHKQVIKKIQDGKKSPEMSPGYMCPLSDTWWFLPAGEALRERIGKKNLCICSLIPLRSPTTGTYTLILHHWSMTTPGLMLSENNTPTVSLC